MPAERTIAPKMQSEQKAVDNYLAKLSEPARTRLEELRSLIRSAAPREAVECISYSMPAFRYGGALVCYAAFKKHYSLFPMSAQLLTDLGKEVSAYKTSKGTIQFPLDSSPPRALVRKIVKIRVGQNQKRKKP